MKKNILAIAIATAFAAPIVSADAPTIYGKINVNINSTTGSDATVNSTASRVGVKGSEDLGNGLKAVYKMEFSVDVAETGAGSLGGRNQYLGLAGGFGTVLMGRHDTPLKMSQPSDLFNDGAADLGAVAMDSGVEVGEARAGDVLAYVSPSFSGVKVIAAAVMGVKKSNVLDDDATSIALTYGSAKKGLYLAAANTSQAINGASNASINRLSAQYKTGGLTVNVMHSDASNTSKTNGSTVISYNGVAVAANAPYDVSGTVTAFQAAYKIGKFMPKLKISATDPKLAGADSTTNTSIGLNYSLGKKTTAYIYMVDADKKNTMASDATIVGMVHKF